MNIIFLEAAQRLAKSFSKNLDGTIEKQSYPNIKLFTSHAESCDTLADFYTKLVAHAKLGRCLLKGVIRSPLVNQSRAGSTTTDDKTDWLCLDFDSAPFASPREALDSIVDGTEQIFKGISHVVQFSASHGIPGSKGLNCHIFLRLSEPVHAPYLKAWIMYLNLRSKSLSDALTLNEIGSHIRWSLDITTAQNDKLLFIAPPVLHGVTSSLKESERYQFIKEKGDLDAMPVARIVSMTMEKARSLAHDRKNELRVKSGLDKQRTTKPRIDNGEFIIHAGEAVITGLRESEGFTHFNLNGGDSWSYWHPVNNFEYIHCFKHPDEKFRTSELLPGYYRQKQAERVANNSAPTVQGEVLLTFSDKRSGKYFRGTWVEDTQELDINPADNVTLLNDFRKDKGRDALDNIPVFDMCFNPHSTVVFDITNRRINTYIATDYMRAEHTAHKGDAFSNFPMIDRIMRHVISNGEHNGLYEFWLNWLAVIYQKRTKTITAWLFRGVEGTGKNIIAEEILGPTLGYAYVQIRRGQELEEPYNGDWLEKSLICFFDEVELGETKSRSKIQSNLRNYITQTHLTIRHMRRQAFMAENFTNFIFATNKSEPLHLNDGDRRYNVGTFQTQKLFVGAVDFKGVIRPQIKAELTAWMDYIMTRKADVALASDSIKSIDRENLIEVSRTSVDNVARALTTGDIMMLYGELPNMDLQVSLHGMNTAFASHYDAIMRREVGLIVSQGREKGAFVTFKSKLAREELQTIFEYCVGNMPDTPIKFTSFLRHRGIIVVSISVEGKSARGIHVEWQITKSQRDELNICHRETPPKTASRISSVVAKAKLKLVN